MKRRGVRMRGIFGPTLCRLVALCLAGVGAAPARAEKPFHAHIHLEPGQWEIRGLHGSGAKPRARCIGDPAMLIQLEHPQANCSRVVLTNNPGMLVVNYVCRMGGYGYTSIRADTPRLARIETQGIAGRAPFAYRAEARRVGACLRQETASR